MLLCDQVHFVDDHCAAVFQLGSHRRQHFHQIKEAFPVQDANGAVMRHNRHQVILLDRAFPDETALSAHLERTLGAHVRALEVQRLDLVNDTTLVDVRFQLLRAPHTAQPTAADAAAAQLPSVASPADNWAGAQHAVAAN